MIQYARISPHEALENMRKLKLLLLGIAIGVVAGFMAFDLAFPSFDPSIWRAYAEATGICPLTTISSVLWSKLVSVGQEPALVSVLSVGLLVFAVFDLLWRLLAILVCPSVENRNWWRLTLPFASFLGCALTAFSEPVWRMALSGTPALMSLALFMLAGDLFLAALFAETAVDEFGEPIGLIRPSLFVYAAFLLSGALSIELPIAVLLPVLFLVASWKVFPRVKDDRYREHPDDVFVFTQIDFSKPIACFCWLIGFAEAVICSGVLKIGILRYFEEQVRAVAGAASPIGWVLWTAGAFVPFVAILRLLPVQTARTGRWSFGRVVTVMLIVAVSLAVVSPFARGEQSFASAVRAPFMQAIGAVLAAQAAALALALFSYSAFHEMEYGRRFGGLATFFVGLALALALAVAVLGVRRDSAQWVRQVIFDAVEEIEREAEGLSWIFTDGSVDIGIELAARRHNSKIGTRPLVADGPFAAADNAEAQLRGWIADDAFELQKSGLLAGFDFWKAAGKPAPLASGLLARSSWPDGARERGIAYVEKVLGPRMMALSRTGALARERDRQVREVYEAILRCVSRMADARRAGGML